MTTKFSQFPEGGNVRVGDTVVGLRNGQNTEFNTPGTGILDENGNFIFSYSGTDAAVNYINFENADTGDAPKIEATGQHITVSLDIETKGNGDLNLNLGTGDLVINDSVGINEVSDDDTFVDASDEMVSTSLAVKTYVDNITGDIADKTFITKTDETADLPNSIPLSSKSTGILANTTGTGVLTARTITGTANQVNVANGDGSANPTLSLSSTLALPGTLTLNGGLASGFLSNTTGTGVLNSRTVTGTANQISVANGDGVSGNPTLTLPATLVAPGTLQATTSLNIGGAGATVTSISTDGTLASNSDTLISTQKAIKTYADSIGGGSVTLTNAGVASGTTSLVNDGVGPALAVKGIVSGTNIAVTTNTTDTTVAFTGTLPIANGGTNNTVLGDPNTIAVSDGTKITYTGDIQPATLIIGGGGSTVNTISNSPTETSSQALLTAEAAQMAIADKIGSAKSFRGGYDASTDLFPVTGGSGVAGAVQAGDVWVITVGGTLDGEDVYPGNTLLALVNLPGQTGSNWAINDNGVATVFGRAGIVVAESGDYSFSLISGTAAISQGGTNAMSIGASGTLAQSSGTAYEFTTATYPSTATSAGKILRADGTNWIESTSTFADTYAQYSILSAGTANTITGLATATRAVLCTKSTGEVFYVPLGSHQYISRGTADDPEAWTSSAGTGILLNINDGTNTSSVGLITPVVIANGGTNTTAAIGASGTFAQSDGSKYTFTTATFPSTATTAGTILRANGTNWVASTSTFADTYTASNLLYSNGANTVTGLATANSAQLVTNSSGVPALTSSMTNGQIVIGSTGATPVPATIASSDSSIVITNGAGTINLITATDNGSITWTNTAVTNVSISSGAGYVELDNVGSISYVLLGGGTNFQLSGTGKLQYTGAAAKKFWVQGGVSHTTVGIAIQLYVNSTTPVGNIGYGAGADKTTMGLVTLNQNDYLSVWGSRIGQSTINVPIHFMNVTATQA